MVKRTIEAKVIAYSKQYPVVTITGPRQSGKTTLCKKLFADKKYFSLESIDTRDYARKDPRGFLEDCLPKGAIIDEIQRVPELVSYIQEIVDKVDRPGLFILTGSQNFELVNTVNQSLAGRTALAVLLPFSFDEIYGHVAKEPDLNKILLNGFFPRIHDKHLDPTEALSFYVSTYLERDIRALLNIKDLNRFEVFLKLCASRVGQILNLSNLANDCGIDHNTAKSWISVLEASYIIFLVRPHYENLGKRLIKAPKLYFTDVGLAAYLMDIDSPAHIGGHPLKGLLFENFIAAEVLKDRFNRGKKNNLYYFRDNVGNEVDLVLEYGTKVVPLEIKLGQTVTDDLLKGLKYYAKINPKKIYKECLVYGGKQSQRRGSIDIIGYRDLTLALRGLESKLEKAFNEAEYKKIDAICLKEHSQEVKVSKKMITGLKKGKSENPKISGG